MFPSRSSFPSSFTWGAAAAAYQIEGAWNLEGKGPSVWDMMTSQPGRIWSGGTGREACDHFHRYEEDIRLMQSLGFAAYRFSISWPRVMPAGLARSTRRASISTTASSIACSMRACSRGPRFFTGIIRMTFSCVAAG